MTEIDYTQTAFPISRLEADVGLARSIGRWLIAHGQEPPAREPVVFYPWVAQQAALHIPDRTAQRRVSMTIILEACEHFGYELLDREHGHLSRLLGLYEPGQVLRAITEALGSAAGLDPEHADRGIMPYVHRVVANWTEVDK